ncbi:restriction endonuclease [Prevotella melaninogenica]|uniref:LlaJI family restriction endonuclease n=1 Tax=Prevotella melaninogenica TaxID=28132 RepID=UPI001C5DF17D|nr:LlaJI family restriction endonuclease [Prevotella melaninogenica]MBW4742422.1 restriction endonuclease [Prevotella melaninogenica]MBW4912728.1 restriction endonuclease [Prevotella melaninogenica]
MRVIIEGYCYRASAVRDVLHELSTLENVGGEISVGYVGYYYNPQLRDCVFILPKVLVNEENKVFSRLDPHDIIDLDNCKLLTSEERNFIYEFAVWIYRAIEVFNKSNPNSGIVLHRKIAEMGKGKRVLSNSFLDILLSLLRFNKEHYSFFTTILRNLHSGYNKINWTRTISRSTAWVQNDVPVYLNPVNKKRQINTDEELIIIYFSILNHISETYGFPVDITLGFELIKGRKFEHYLKGYGKRRLQQIKYRYFSDIQLRLWEMCYAFFDKAHQIHIVAEQREYLLVKNFNIVFEAIIDELIGDKEPPRGLKDQDDGKRVDHIYSYRNLTNNEEDRPIYYIGDSKYYKIGNKISAESVYKQFTYARNVIQWNLNLFLDNSEENAALRKEHPIYRDEQTEGYNIVPNFFISAKMDEKLSYADNVSTINRENNTFLSRHFENRLFDRDTLLVYHYDVNFLYVVSLYARENAHQKAQWKQKVRELFREKIQAALEENYKFYAMTPKPGVNHEKYLRENFQELLGKVYRPFDDTNYLSLALDKQKESENKDLLDKLQKDYYVVECPLGKNPTSVLSGEKAQNSSEAVHGRKGVLMVMMEKYATKSANFSHGKLAIAIKMTVESMDIVENLSNIGYVLFHHRSDNDQHLFSVKGTCTIKAAGELEDDRYKNIGNKELYISVDIDTTELLNDNLHASIIKPASKETRYDAQFAWLSELRGNE